VDSPPSPRVSDTDRIEVPLDRAAPASSRGFVADRVRLDPIRAAESSLLVSELVTAALRHAGSETIGIRVDRRETAVRVTVTGGQSATDLDDVLIRSLLDGMSRSWGTDESVDAPHIWFEVRRPGSSVGSVASLETDVLLGRVNTDPEARDEVMRRFTPLATGIARRYRGKGISLDDLEQVALLGMLRALGRYDPGVGAFEPFAAKTVSGEMKRHLRDRAWSVRVPRSLQERALEVTRTAQELGQKLGRSVTTHDIAQAMDITPEEVLEARSATHAYTSSSLDAPLGTETSGTLGDTLGDLDNDLGIAERWQEIEPALEALPERQRHILYLRFYEDMTQTEIADVVGISQMHVSRLLARAIDRLRSVLE
jgi:RNA polymerase sigma-B factor